jgi:cytochrome c oxidase cbb3-type subunit 2
MTRVSWIPLVVAAVGLPLAGCAAPPTVPAEVGEIEAAIDTGDTLEYPRWETHEPGDFATYNRRTNLLQRGHEVYVKYCAGCHGENGVGDGPAAVRLITQPRDFTSGIYKFRSTDSGSLPLEVDLYRTITRGLSGVSMPAFPLMPHRDKLAVIEYIKRLYPDWETEAGRRVIVPIPRAPADVDSPRRIERGRIVYVSMQCTQCHGTDGRGTGATQTEYVDAWDNPQKPFDFTRGSLKGGNTPEDIYRTFHTGLRSIMPSFDGTTLMTVAQTGFPPQEGLLGPGELEQLAPALTDFPDTVSAVFAMSSDEQRDLGLRNSWDLVAYIRSLRLSETTAEAVLGRSVEGAAR